MTGGSHRSGFSIVELLVALVILTVGMLAMASASGYSTLAVRMAGSRTARAEAVASEIELARARSYNGATWSALTSTSQSQADTVGHYLAWYTIAPPTGRSLALRQLTIFTLGPSYRAGTGWSTSVPDTFVTQLLRPAS